MLYELTTDVVFTALKEVLILVLLENALRGVNRFQCEIKYNLGGLNPCFVGKCSTSYVEKNRKNQQKVCLNPCFVGKCSTSKLSGLANSASEQVLILVLLENALRATIHGRTHDIQVVLILVLLENALRASSCQTVRETT